MISELPGGLVKYLIIACALCAAAYIPYYLYRRSRHKKVIGKFLAENPFPAKIYIESGSNIIKNGEMTVLSVNGKEPVFFSENKKDGFYAAPGENEISASYSWTRRGILNKNITTEISQNRQVVAVEAGKEYVLAFDKDSGLYSFFEK